MIPTISSIILLGLFFGGASIAIDHKWGLKDYFDEQRRDAKFFKKWCFFCIYFWISIFLIFPVEFCSLPGQITLYIGVISFLKSFFYALCAAYCGSVFQSLFNYLNT